MIAIFSGCDGTEVIKKTIIKEKEIIIDYSSSISFEKAISEQKDVNGKIVKVLISEVIEINDSLTKFKSGNNLIFNETQKINIEAGDYIFIKVIQEPIKEEDKWQVNFEFIKLIDSENKIEQNDDNEPIDDSLKIKMDKESSDYIGLDRVEIQKEFEKKGFKNIEVIENKTTDSNNKNNAVLKITINGNDFKKDDQFNKEDKIIITYWKYEKSVSKYELAFIRDLSNYDLYYMFDIDTKEVVYFGTNDTYIDEGLYSGDFNSGVIINWFHGEWTERFVNKNGSSSAILTDGNGFEWEYEKCDVEKAQKVLSGLK